MVNFETSELVTPSDWEIRVKYKDVFHYKNLFVMMHEYLLEEGWDDTLKSKHSAFETFYLHKEYQKAARPGHIGGAEEWIWFRVEKDPDKKKGYFKWRLEIDFHLAVSNVIEVMHQGKKLKADKGELEIFIRPKCYIDPGEMGGKPIIKHPFWKHFYKLWRVRILKNEIEKMEKELWREAYRMQGKFKKYLDMRTFVPIPERFWEKKFGYKNV